MPQNVTKKLQNFTKMSQKTEKSVEQKRGLERVCLFKPMRMRQNDMKILQSATKTSQKVTMMIEKCHKISQNVTKII